MSTGRRLAILAGLIVIAVVAFVIINPGGGDNNNDKGGSSASNAARPVFQVIKIQNGKPVGGVQKIKVSKGDRVRFIVRSDVSDEVHVHGYDFHKDVKAGKQVRFNFPASIDGNFVIELENAKQQIAALQVEP